MTLHAPNQIPNSTTAHELIDSNPKTQNPWTQQQRNALTHPSLTQLHGNRSLYRAQFNISDYPQIIHSQKYNAENPWSSLYNSLPPLTP
jgi:hypothetical protein